MYGMGSIQQIVEWKLEEIEGPGDRGFRDGVIHKLF
jgi:hypothetical protein